MSRRKRGTTNVALNLEELHLMKDGLHLDRGGLTGNPDAADRIAALEALDCRLDKAVIRCLRNGGINA